MNGHDPQPSATWISVYKAALILNWAIIASWGILIVYCVPYLHLCYPCVQIYKHKLQHTSWTKSLKMIPSFAVWYLWLFYLIYKSCVHTISRLNFLTIVPNLYLWVDPLPKLFTFISTKFPFGFIKVVTWGHQTRMLFFFCSINYQARI